MKHSIAAFLAAALCLGASLSAGWLWQTMGTTRYEASARLQIRGQRQIAPADLTHVAEAEILAPEVLSEAALRMQERGLRLPVGQHWDSHADYLVANTRILRPDRAQPGEVGVSCQADDGKTALRMVESLVDAYLAVREPEPAETGNEESLEIRAQLEVELDHLARAIDRQLEKIDDLNGALEAEHLPATESASAAPEQLESELAQIRQAHREAAARLADARRDVDNQSPVETVAARLTDPNTRTGVLERLNQMKIRAELQHQSALWQQWSTTYGRNHPRMVEIQQKIAALQKQLHGFPNDEAVPDTGDAPPGAIVLAAFEQESVQLEVNERKLIAHLNEVQGRYQDQQELELQLVEARQELSFLQSESERTRRQLAAARHEHPEVQQALLVAPTLDGAPLEKRVGLPMAVSCVTGMSLYLLLLWQIRARWQAPRNSQESGDQYISHRASRPERFRSQEEERLLRLKLAAQT